MKLTGGDKIVVGYDINNSYSQISYARIGAVKSGSADGVETLSSVAGEEVYNIPTVLCKRPGTNQWTYGKEALKHAQERDGILVENLLELAVDGEPLQIEGQSFSPQALLTLFLKRSLGMLSQVTTPDRVAAVMITSEKLGRRVLEVLRQAAEGAGLNPDRVFFLSHGESFYHYMLYQPEELRRFQSLLCEYRGEDLRTVYMDCNRQTRPAAVFQEEEILPFVSYDPMPEAEDLRREKMSRMDGEFRALLEGLCENRMISSVYLIGEYFSQEWMKESLKYLCKDSRVFQGNNLYSKGACFGMLERMKASEAGNSHVFLGPEKLKVNIGMKMKRRGQDSYCALLDAGVNWYEAEKIQEFYLQEGNTVEIRITSLTGGKNKLASILLEELESGAARLQMRLKMRDEIHLIIEIEDLGFGVFREATHRVWTEELEL